MTLSILFDGCETNPKKTEKKFEKRRGGVGLRQTFTQERSGGGRSKRKASSVKKGGRRAEERDGTSSAGRGINIVGKGSSG